MALDSIEGARKGPLPASPSVQLATLVSDVPTGGEWLHEIKLDGYRLICRVAEGRVRLVTRNAKDWTDKFRGVAEAAAALPCQQALLDGEAVVLNERGISDFQALQNVLGRRKGAPVLYYAFDLLYLDGYDLTHVLLRARKEALAGLLAPLAPDGVIRYSDHVEGHGQEFYAQACAAGLEGIISKRADRRYRAGRGAEWLKVKCLHRQEFVVVGFTDPQRSRQGFGALVLGVNDPERGLVLAGRVGTGFTERSLRELHAKLVKLERSTPPVVDPPTGAALRGVHWVEPRLVAEVAFAEWTGDGRIRHPSFHGLREDKAPEQVVRERATSRSKVARPPNPGAESASRAGRSRSRPRAPTVKLHTTVKKPHTTAKRSRAASPELRVAGVRITNPDRVLYKPEGFTKGDIARYWGEVAEAALPLLVERPLILFRCPTGPGGECFFQRHWGQGMPDSIPRVRLKEQRGVAQYMYVDALPALISLVQFSVLEVHVFNCRRDRPERPDQVMFDLDPDEALPWSAVVDAAIGMRERLGALELESFVKTTGGKGLHVVVPLARRARWDEVREFARGLAEQFAKAAPDRFTATMSKRRRVGRIYIDYLRNAFSASAIAAYSTRARPGAPVAVPIGWAELEAMDARPKFDIRTVPERLRKQRRDPWEGFSRVRQSISSGMRKAVGVR